MGAMSTTRYFLDWIKQLRYSVLFLGLLAVALFVMVPQMASVDSDDDGIPDLPAIAIGASPIAHPSSSARKNSRLQKTPDSVVLALVVTGPHHLEANKSDFVSHDGRSILQSFCLRRC